MHLGQPSFLATCLAVLAAAVSCGSRDSSLKKTAFNQARSDFNQRLLYPSLPFLFLPWQHIYIIVFILFPAVFGIVHVMFPAYLSKYMSSLIHTAVTWCVSEDRWSLSLQPSCCCLRQLCHRMETAGLQWWGAICTAWKCHERPKCDPASRETRKSVRFIRWFWIFSRTWNPLHYAIRAVVFICEGFIGIQTLFASETTDRFKSG